MYSNVIQLVSQACMTEQFVLSFQQVLQTCEFRRARRDNGLGYVDVLEILVKGLEKQGMPYVVSESPDNLPVIIRFEGADESDCSLSITTSVDKVEVCRVIGRGVIKQSYDFEDIDDSFFELLKEHRDTIKGLLKMREQLLGGR
jgi:hypothetical protein